MHRVASYMCAFYVCASVAISYSSYIILANISSDTYTAS